MTSQMRARAFVESS